MEGVQEEDSKMPAAEKEAEMATSGSDHSGEKAVKKRTWKKPKDKPKRPLSAYNLFFQHARTRIVEGLDVDTSPEETVQSIEGILSKSRQKRRHRKSHGKISFADLARTIADQWKSIKPQQKEIFDHYAEIDMVRYRKELKQWKEKKELEFDAAALAKHNSFIHRMSNSFNSSSASEASNIDESSVNSSEMHDSFNSSHSSLGDFKSPDRRRMKAESMNLMIQRQQQILQQQLRQENPQFVGMARMGTDPQGQAAFSQLPGSAAFHQSFNNFPLDFNDSQSDLSQATSSMQQLKVQQQQHLEQMRRLQMQQQQIQQQIEFNSRQLRQSAGFANMMTMGHASFPDFRSNQFMNSSLPDSAPMQSTSLGHGNLDRSLHLRDALQSHHLTHPVSDYSSSTLGGQNSGVFGASMRSTLATSHSDGFPPGGSMQGSMNFPQDFTRQQNNSFNGSMSSQNNGSGLGGLRFSGNPPTGHPRNRMDADNSSMQ